MIHTIAVLLGISVVIAAVWNPTDDEGKHNFVSSVINAFFCLSIVAKAGIAKSVANRMGQGYPG